MNPEAWRRVEATFLRALDVAPNERSSFLAHECADSPDVRAEVERLLEHNRHHQMTVLQHQRYLGLGATISIVGLALVGTHASNVGAFVVIVGLLVLMGSVHRFGRLGTEKLES